MNGLKDGAFSRPISAMTLSECVLELEALDRIAQASDPDQAADRGEDRRVEFERRRSYLHKEVKVRPAATQEDALAKFRWVLYETRHKSRLTGANTNDLVGLMKQVAAFPVNSDRDEGEASASGQS